MAPYITEAINNETPGNGHAGSVIYFINISAISLITDHDVAEVINENRNRNSGFCTCLILM